MKFFYRPGVEQAEANYIGAAFAKRYDPHGPVTLNDDCVFDHAGVETVVLENETLAIDPQTVSWAFLNQGELDLYKQMRKRTLRSLRDIWPTDTATPPESFVSALYRRGLLSINGMSAVDEKILADSPNYPEGHLVELLLTERCNLACGYCLAGANNKMPAMNWDIAKKAVDLAFAMEEADTIAFEYAGGEPMLQFSLMQRLTDYIESHPLRGDRRLFLSIQTNATLINDERAKWLKEKNIRVGISVDGKPASQNVSRPQVKGGESYSMLIRGIDALQRQGVPFGALVVLNRSNVDSAEDLVDFLLDNAIHGFRLNPVAYIGDARQNWDAVGLTQEEVISYFQELMQLITRRQYLLLEDNIHTMCEFLTSKQRRTRCMRAECGAGDTFQAVAASGDIYPCGRATQSPGLKLGNIFEDGVESLSAPARSNPNIVQIRGRRPQDFDDCSRCYYRQLCQSGCSAQAWERYGTVRHKTPECAFYKTLYPYLMRWLSFDNAAFNALNSSNYFDGGGMRFDYDFAGAN